MMRRSMIAALMLVAATLPSSAGTVQGVVQGTKTAGQGTAEAGRGLAQGTATVARGTGQATVGVARGSATIVKKTGNGVWCVVTLDSGC